MIPKSVMTQVVEKQLKALEDRQPGQTRRLLGEMPYLTDRALLLGGVRGAGRSTLLLQMMRTEYPQAWYTDFEDPRLGGFDAGDFGKLGALVAESGRGVVLLDKVDRAADWMPFVCGLLDGGLKVVATVSLGTLVQLQRAQRMHLTGRDDALRHRMPGRKPGRAAGVNRKAAGRGNALTADGLGSKEAFLRGGEPAASRPELPADGQARMEACCERFLLYRVPLFSYGEFLEIHHKRPSEGAVQEYMQRGAFPEQQKAVRQAALFDLYETIVARDVLLANGVRDQDTLRRIALRLLSASGESVTANALRKELKVKAVTTVTEHMEHLERAGLVAFVPYWSENPARRYVNPRKVYAVDTALAAALTLRPHADRAKSFETMIYRHLADRYDELFYTSEDGGCDFVAMEEGRPVLCVQACYDGEDPDRLQQKAEGLVRALEMTRASRGLIVTASLADRMLCGGREIEIADADTFLGE